MSDALLLAATGALDALGLLLIALSQKRHRRLVHPSGFASSPTALRLAGSLLIGHALLAAVQRDGWAFGLLVWVTMLTFSALAVVAGLAKQHGRRGGQSKDG